MYERYERELSAGATYLVPEVQDLTMQPGEAARMDDLKKPGDGECSECAADVDDNDAYCSSCGAKLTKRKSSSNRRSAA